MSQQHQTSITTRTVLGAGWMVVWRMVTRLLGLISTLVLARILVPADFGLVALATASSDAVEALSVLGLDDALIRDQESSRSLNDTAFSLMAARGVLNAALIAALAYPASVWLVEPRLVPIFLVLSALTLIAGFENIGIVEFRRNLQFQREFMLLFPPRLCGVLTTIVLAIQFRTYWALVAGILVARLMRFIMTYWLSAYRPRFSLERWRHLVAFSFWTWATGIAALCWDRSETFILGHAMGSKSVGLFLIAAEVAVLPITELVSPAVRALFAGLSAAQNRGTDLSTASVGVTAALMILVMPLAIAVSAAAGDITHVLLGPAWLAAEPLISILAMASFASVFSFVFSAVLVARAQVRERFFVVSISATVKIPFIYAAALTGDLKNVALVSVAGAVGEAFLFYLRLKQVSTASMRFVTPDLLRTFVATLVSVGILYTTGIGWRGGATSPVAAVVDAMGVGASTVASFLVVQLGLWAIAGRPQGGESRLIGIALQMITRTKPRAAAD
jgi:lipopolysaccharide exporter